MRILLTKKSIVLYLSITAIIILLFFFIRDFILPYRTFNTIISSDKRYSLIPTSTIRVAPKHRHNTIKYTFDNLVFYLPDNFIKDKELEQTIAFKDKANSTFLILMKNDKKLIPKMLQDRYKNSYDFFRDVIYAQEDPELLMFKPTVIPFAGENMTISELYMGDMQGFMYKGNDDTTTIYIFELFMNDENIRVHIATKDNNLKEDEIYYIVSSLKKLE